jgi:hypothetical protein
MDERYRNKGVWIAVAAVAAIIFLCVTLCFLGALGTAFMRSGAVVAPQIQLPAGGEGVVPPQVYHGPWGGGRSGMGLLGLFGFGAVLLFGLLLVLGIGRLVLGPRHCAPPHGGPHPMGTKWKDHFHAWGPRAWHTHGKEWREGGEPTESQDPMDDQDLAYDEAE